MKGCLSISMLLKYAVVGEFTFKAVSINETLRSFPSTQIWQTSIRCNLLQPQDSIQRKNSHPKKGLLSENSSFVSIRSVYDPLDLVLHSVSLPQGFSPVEM